ncbi:Gfo/Idh/MocA family protein [Paenibacillus sp. IITD108]|uniref:Gfo/Idh/MocA family protein n=1 Tax=Paenibacillus sp. IITD108 TaxID=3116649 RepID=UPI002F400D88
MYNVGIVGFGKSGSRFVRAFIYLQRKYKNILLKGVCDRNIDKVKRLSDYGIEVYNSFDEFIQKDEYDILVISTNEDSHYDLLCEVKKKSKRCKKIIIEKLLVEKLHQAYEVKRMFDDSFVSVHFVERHSPVIEELIRWMKHENLSVSRCSFFWGKYRLYDKRPTIGVSSEICHPIDLAIMLSDTKPGAEFEILQGNYVCSNYSHSGKNLIDTMSVNIMLQNKILINGNSSFLWYSRKRELNLFLINDIGIISYVVEIIFDNPHWDIDTCTINEINKNGSKKLIKRFNAESFDNKTACITKTIRFIEENINEVKYGDVSGNIVHINQAVYIQEIIAKIEKHSKKNKVVSIFNKEIIQEEEDDTPDEWLFDYLDELYEKIDVSKIDNLY